MGQFSCGPIKLSQRGWRQAVTLYARASSGLCGARQNRVESDALEFPSTVVLRRIERVRVLAECLPDVSASDHREIEDGVEKRRLATAVRPHEYSCRAQVKGRSSVYEVVLNCELANVHAAPVDGPTNDGQDFVCETDIIACRLVWVKIGLRRAR